MKTEIRTLRELVHVFQNGTLGQVTEQLRRMSDEERRMRQRKKETQPRKPGGGRKPKTANGSRVKRSLMLDPAVLASLAEQSEREGKSLSDVLNERLSKTLPTEQ